MMEKYFSASFSNNVKDEELCISAAIDLAALAVKKGPVALCTCLCYLLTENKRLKQQVHMLKNDLVKLQTICKATATPANHPPSLGKSKLQQSNAVEVLPLSDQSNTITSNQFRNLDQYLESHGTSFQNDATRTLENFPAQKLNQNYFSDDFLLGSLFTRNDVELNATHKEHASFYVPVNTCANKDLLVTRSTFEHSDDCHGISTRLLQSCGRRQSNRSLQSRCTVSEGNGENINWSRFSRRRYRSLQISCVPKKCTKATFEKDTGQQNNQLPCMKNSVCQLYRATVNVSKNEDVATQPTHVHQDSHQGLTSITVAAQVHRDPLEPCTPSASTTSSLPLGKYTDVAGRSGTSYNKIPLEYFDMNSIARSQEEDCISIESDEQDYEVVSPFPLVGCYCHACTLIRHEDTCCNVYVVHEDAEESLVVHGSRVVVAVPALHHVTPASALLCAADRELEGAPDIVSRHRINKKECDEEADTVHMEPIISLSPPPAQNTDGTGETMDHGDHYTDCDAVEEVVVTLVYFGHDRSTTRVDDATVAQPVGLVSLFPDGIERFVPVSCVLCPFEEDGVKATLTSELSKSNSDNVTSQRWQEELYRSGIKHESVDWNAKRRISCETKDETNQALTVSEHTELVSLKPLEKEHCLSRSPSDSTCSSNSVGVINSPSLSLYAGQTGRCPDVVADTGQWADVGYYDNAAFDGYVSTVNDATSDRAGYCKQTSSVDYCTSEVRAELSGNPSLYESVDSAINVSFANSQQSEYYSSSKGPAMDISKEINSSLQMQIENCSKYNNERIHQRTISSSSASSRFCINRNNEQLCRPDSDTRTDMFTRAIKVLFRRSSVADRFPSVADDSQV